MKELRVTPICNGTVIDHISPGRALDVLRIIAITGKGLSSTVSVVMHVPSGGSGWKDIVKVEDRELLPGEVSKITLVAPDVTINIIRNYEVAKKYRPTAPDEVVGLVRCANPSCITNKAREPVESKFKVLSRKPVKLRCRYCERVLTEVTPQLL